MTLNAIIDSHIHLDDASFDADRDQLVQEARDGGAGAMIVPATHASNWQAVLQTSAHYQSAHAALGLHPMFCNSHQISDIQALEKIILQQNPLAIGECGLDRQHKSADLTEQAIYFRAQIELSAQYSLPLIVHARGAVEDVLLAVKAEPGCFGVVHSFNGSQQQAERLIENGFMLGFGGAATWPRARKLRRLVADLPVNSLLLETDAPFQPVYQQSGTRNKPANIVAVAANVAAIRNTTEAQMIAQCNDNARRLFRLPSAPDGRSDTTG